MKGYASQREAVSVPVQFTLSGVHVLVCIIHYPRIIVTEKMTLPKSHKHHDCVTECCTNLVSPLQVRT